jgi:hypothetical protein
MVVKVLATDAGVSMSVRIVSPTEDSRVRNIAWKKVAEPMYAIRGRPRLVTVSIQPMDGNDTKGNVRTHIAGNRRPTYSTIGLMPSAIISNP